MDEIALPVGAETWTVRVPAGRLAPLSRAAPVAVPDPAAALADAVRRPARFEPLRRVLAPADAVTIVLDERLPALLPLLGALLDEFLVAGVRPETVTVLTPPGSASAWLDDLPDAYEELRVEVHDPAERKKLAYLANTRGGRRVYLNKSLVDADQVVILAGRRYDARGEPTGAAELLFPACSDAETRADSGARTPAEAAEVASLLGLPYAVEAVPAGSDGVAVVIAGDLRAAAAGRDLLEQHWHARLSARADLVIATVGGDPRAQTTGDLAAALRAATECVEDGGRLVLLSQVGGTLPPAMEVLRLSDEPRDALKALKKIDLPGRDLARAWAAAADRARVLVASGFDADAVEGLHALAVEGVGPVQRLIDAAARVALLPDAHRLRVTAD